MNTDWPEKDAEMDLASATEDLFSAALTIATRHPALSERIANLGVQAGALRAELQSVREEDARRR